MTKTNIFIFTTEFTASGQQVNHKWCLTSQQSVLSPPVRILDSSECTPLHGSFPAYSFFIGSLGDIQVLASAGGKSEKCLQQHTYTISTICY